MSEVKGWDVRLRKASGVDNVHFPYGQPLVTLVRISLDEGLVEQAKSRAEKIRLLMEAGPNDVILACWPGQWSQDIFLVDDDLEEIARGL